MRRNRARRYWLAEFVSEILRKKPPDWVSIIHIWPTLSTNRLRVAVLFCWPLWFFLLQDLYDPVSTVDANSVSRAQAHRRVATADDGRDP